MKSDINLNIDVLYIIKLFSQRIIETYYRRYVKIQDLIANIGGLIKFLFTLGKFIVYIFSYTQLAIDISHSFFLNQDNSNQSRSINILESVKLSPLSKSPLKKNFLSMDLNNKGVKTVTRNSNEINIKTNFGGVEKNQKNQINANFNEKNANFNKANLKLSLKNFICSFCSKKQKEHNNTYKSMYNFLKIPLNYKIILNKMLVVDYLTKKNLEEDTIRPCVMLSDIEKYVELNNRIENIRKDTEENFVLFQKDFKKPIENEGIKEINENINLLNSKYSNRKIRDLKLLSK
jgi:hypothetical protein